MKSPLFYLISPVSQVGRRMYAIKQTIGLNDKALNLWQRWILKTFLFQVHVLTLIKDKTSLFRQRHTERGLLLQGLLTLKHTSLWQISDLLFLGHQLK